MRTRYPLLLLLALIALSGSLTAVFATAALRDYDLRGYVDPTQNSDLPYRVPRFGVNVELRQYDSDELPRQFELMRAAQVHWLRQFVSWRDIESAPGDYDWSTWDRIFATLADYPDLHPVVVLMFTPSWAISDASQNTSASAPPADPAAFASFARVFAQRYADQVHFYQIWDEPNLTTAWGGLDPRPAAYAALLQGAYTAIHSADPQATVIAAALAPTTETGPRNLSDWQYLRDLYALGAADFMDAAAGKPYGFNASPQDRTVRADVLNFSRFVGLREVMTDASDGKTALWAMNWGWNSLPDDWQGSPSIWGSVNETTRTTYTLEALNRAEREWAWTGGMILYHWQPDAAPDDPVWGFALLNPDDSPAPLYTALVNREAPVAAADGLYPAANPYARYSGIWTFSDLGADIGWLNDSHLAFDFAGRDLALLLRQDDYVGYLYPRIDGEANRVNTLPQDTAGNPYVILTSGSLEPELTLVPVARNLAPGNHTLTAAADRGYDRYALAGYAVSSGDLAAPYNTQISTAWFAVVVSGLAVLVIARQIQWQLWLQPINRLMRGLSVVRQIALGTAASLLVMVGMLLTFGEATPALFRRDSVQFGLSIITAGLIYLSPALPLTLLALLILLLLLYHRPEIGLALIVFFLPFFLFPVELYRFAFPMAELLTLVTFAAWLLRSLVQWAQDRRQTGIHTTPALRVFSRWQALDWLILGWVALGLVSLLWTSRPGPAVTELRTLLIEPTLFYLMFRTLPLSRRDVLRLVDALLLAGVIVCVIGLILYLRGEAIITAEDTARRLASVYGSPNNVALFLGRCLPFALAFLVLPVDRPRRLAAGLTLSLVLLTALLTQSVGGLFIGIPVSLAVVLLLVYRRQAVLPLLLLGVLTLAGFLVGASVSERFARALDFTQGTNFYRIRVWQSALNVIQDHPLTGLGLDQFLYAFRGHYIYPDAWQEPNLSHPHNVLLDVWVRLGLVGVLFFAAIQVRFWQQLRRGLAAARTTDPLILAIITGTGGSMTSLLAHGMIDNSIFVLDLAFILILLLALATRFLPDSAEIPPQVEQ